MPTRKRCKACKARGALGEREAGGGSPWSPSVGTQLAHLGVEPTEPREPTWHHPLWRPQPSLKLRKATARMGPLRLNPTFAETAGHLALRDRRDRHLVEFTPLHRHLARHQPLAKRLARVTATSPASHLIAAALAEPRALHLILDSSWAFQACSQAWSLGAREHWMRGHL